MAAAAKQRQNRAWSIFKTSSANIFKIKALSVVTSDRNEVWFIIPISENENHTTVMIYDYLRGEWVKRICQKINTVNTIENTLYSAGKEIYQEYEGNSFDGEFKTNALNLIKFKQFTYF